MAWLARWRACAEPADEGGGVDLGVGAGVFGGVAVVEDGLGGAGLGVEAVGGEVPAVSEVLGVFEPVELAGEAGGFGVGGAC